MHVTHVAPAGLHPYSGVLTALSGLAAALARTGTRVDVVHLSAWDSPQFAAMTTRLTAAGVTVRPGRGFEPTDVTHLHNVFNVANVRMARRLAAMGAAYVVSPHGGYAAAALQQRPLRKSVFARAFERPMLHGAARLFALSEVEEGEIRALGVATPVTVVPNGTEPPPPHDAAALRSELGIGGAPLAVFTGRLDVAHKRIDDVVAGLVRAPAWHLAVVGPDFRGGRRLLARQAASLAVDDRVHFTGPRRDSALYGALAAADAFVLPSRWEGFPMTLLEAASVGTPALVSAAVEARTGVAAAGAGLVAAGDWGAALGAWPRRDDEARAALVAAARSFAQTHSWDALAGRYLDGYLAASQRPPPQEHTAGHPGR